MISNFILLWSKNILAFFMPSKLAVVYFRVQCVGCPGDCSVCTGGHPLLAAGGVVYRSLLGLFFDGAICPLGLIDILTGFSSHYFKLGY